MTSDERFGMHGSTRSRVILLQLRAKCHRSTPGQVHNGTAAGYPVRPEWLQFQKCREFAMDSHEIDRFELKTGEVPSHPFLLLPSIAARARKILSSRTEEQIASVANSIDWVIASFLRAEREQEIERLRSILASTHNWRNITPDVEDEYRKATRFFYWEVDGEDGGGTWQLNQDLLHELPIPRTDNMSRVDALIECINLWDDIGGDEFPDERPTEVFAVLSLSLLSDAIAWLRYRSEEAPRVSPDGEVPKSEAAPAKRSVDEIGVTLSLAGECAINAMHAVCYAEQLGVESDLHRNYEYRDAIRLADERKRRSIVSERLNIERHRVTNQAKAIAIEEWDRDRSKFPSAERAGLAISDLLQGKGFEFEPRTVTGWIRTHAKQVGQRLR